LQVLLKLYFERKDLQEVFPEVRNGDVRRLIDWASGVSTHKWEDSSHPILQPYADWYCQNAVGDWSITPPEITSWLTIELTSRKSDNPIPFTLSVMQDESASDINQHLVTLAMLVMELGLRQIVELGTRDGSSTLALLEAAQKVNGHVLSIDIEPCEEAKQKIMQSGLAPYWTFIQADDVALESAQIPAIVDLLFIDTNHIYTQTIAELRKYGGHLRPGSWIALHDYASYPGVSRAVGEFLDSLPRKARFYPFVHQNGLALIRL